MTDKAELKLYLNTTFDGFYPIGNTAAVIAAHCVEEAVELLNEKLNSIGLQGEVEPWQLVCLSDATEPGAIIACDGNY